MNNGHGQPDAAVIEAYLDGTLEAAQRAEFEGRIALDPALAAALESQRAIDQSLRRQFAAPPVAAALARFAASQPASAPHAQAEPAPRSSTPSPSPSPRPQPPRRTNPFRLLTITAAAAVIAIAATLVINYFISSVPPLDPNRVRDFASIYDDVRAGKLSYGQNVRGPADVEAYIHGRFHKDIHITGDPQAAGVALGAIYGAPSISKKSACMTTKINGKDVLVFFDDASSDHPEVRDACGTNLKCYRKQVGDLVAYEISPFDQPHVLDLLQAAAPTADSQPAL